MWSSSYKKLFFAKWLWDIFLSLFAWFPIFNSDSSVFKNYEKYLLLIIDHNSLVKMQDVYIKLLRVDLQNLGTDTSKIEWKMDSCQCSRSPFSLWYWCCSRGGKVSMQFCPSIISRVAWIQWKTKLDCFRKSCFLLWIQSYPSPRLVPKSALLF